MEERYAAKVGVRGNSLILERCRQVSETAPNTIQTPDGRYIVVRGRLWRLSNPKLADTERQEHVDALMHARRAVSASRRSQDQLAEKEARAAVHRAKIDIGERGPVWWEGGEPDLTRKLAKNTIYADWYAKLY